MVGWLRAEADRASFSNRFSRSASEATAAGSTLIATSRESRVVPRPLHLSHAAGAQGREDLVGAEAATGRERHCRITRQNDTRSAARKRRGGWRPVILP